jgi:hypothetical protein
VAATRATTEADREAEVEAGEVAHGERVGAAVDHQRERRLHGREGGDDLAPDVLDRGQRQGAAVAGDEAAHHVGLAAGPEGGAGQAGALGGDQRVDHRAPLDEQAVHLGIDGVDPETERGERRRVAFAGVACAGGGVACAGGGVACAGGGHGRVSGWQQGGKPPAAARLIRMRHAEIKENVYA